MMNHLNSKSLIFYGIAIGSVVGLFKGVTVYGEGNLKAPPAIDGRYTIDAPTWQGCSDQQPLLLTIQQSGIYLSGSLQTEAVIKQAQTPISEKPFLFGQWTPQTIHLSGTVPSADFCRPALGSDVPNPPTPPAKIPIQIRGGADGKTLQGTITWGTEPAIATFQAARQASAPTAASH